MDSFEEELSRRFVTFCSVRIYIIPVNNFIKSATKIPTF